MSTRPTETHRTHPLDVRPDLSILNLIGRRAVDTQTAKFLHSVLESVACRLVGASGSDQVPVAYEHVAQAIFALEGQYPQILEGDVVIVDLDKCLEEQV